MQVAHKKYPKPNELASGGYFPDLFNRKSDSCCRLDLGHLHEREDALAAAVHEQVKDAEPWRETMTVGPELVIWHIGNGQAVGALGSEHLPQVATGISHNAAIQELDCDGQVKEIDDEMREALVEVEQAGIAVVEQQALQVVGNVVEVGRPAVGRVECTPVQVSPVGML